MPDDGTRSRDKDVFEINSAEAYAPVHDIAADRQEEQAKLPSVKKARSKPKSFGELQKLISAWQPSDPKASRRMLTSEIMNLLEERGFTHIKACIPSVIVEGQYPIDLMHYNTDQDIYEFVTRMMWMQQEYGKALGIMVGVDDDVAAKVEDACGSLIGSEEDCLIILI